MNTRILSLSAIHAHIGTNVHVDRAETFAGFVIYGTDQTLGNTLFTAHLKNGGLTVTQCVPSINKGALTAVLVGHFINQEQFLTYDLKEVGEAMVPKRPVKTWKENPADQDAAIGAAAHYAKSRKLPAYIIPMARHVFGGVIGACHVVMSNDNNAIGRLMPTGTAHVAIVNPDLTVQEAILYRIASS